MVMFIFGSPSPFHQTMHKKNLFLRVFLLEFNVVVIVVVVVVVNFSLLGYDLRKQFHFIMLIFILSYMSIFKESHCFY